MRSRPWTVLMFFYSGFDAVEDEAIALMRHLFQEPGDPDDGGGAGFGLDGDLAIGFAAGVEQARDLPALGEGAEFRRRAKIGQEGVDFLTRLQRQQGVVKGGAAARRGGGVAGGSVGHGVPLGCNSGTVKTVQTGDGASSSDWLSAVCE